MKALIYKDYGGPEVMALTDIPESQTGQRDVKVRVHAAGLNPVAGLDVMYARRPRARRDRDLGAGPARLAQALGLTGADDGSDLVRGPVRILDDGVPPPAEPEWTTRIGLAPGRGDEHPWRCVVPGSPYVSPVRPRRPPVA